MKFSSIPLQNFFLAATSAFFILTTATAAPLGDRLVLTINNLPYSQLQIESYLNVKESLRNDPARSQLVDATNWEVALPSFAHDMTLYQEANRTSGFRPSRDIVNKVMEKVQTSIQANDRFRVRFLQLGLDSAGVNDQLIKILTIENLRKARSGMQGSKAAPTGQNKWEDELSKRAVIRWFDRAKIYEHLAVH